MKASIRVSGNIIGELSEKIPSNVIALNELMKNAYDAGASCVNIRLDSIERTLTITDDGCGMDVNDINTLFHISNSEKQYGTINKYGRYTQGSKGLGFLSVFKFGTNVLWRTNKSEGLQFSVDFNGLVACDDISNYPIELFQDASIAKGTEIRIDLSEYSLQSLISYLSNPINSSKIVNAFDDDQFMVVLAVDAKTLTSQELPSLYIFLEDRQLYHVRYDSSYGKFQLLINGYLAVEQDLAINDHRYKVDLELVIFHLRPYDKEKIHPFFRNPKGELTPLVFVNSNLFNNYSLFDPNIMRQVKSSSVLGQMIGYVRITSSDKSMNFNSDRTQFLQNQLTDNVTQFLVDLNKLIQETGSDYKACLPDLDILIKTKLPYNVSEEGIHDNIKPEFRFKDQISIENRGNYIEYAIFGKKIPAVIEERKTSSAKTVPARIVLADVERDIAIPSKQIDLCSYIAYVLTSKSEKVSSAEVTIYIDGNLSTNKILNSVAEETEIVIRFSYNDTLTGDVIEEITLNFYQPEAEVTAETTVGKLLTIHAMSSYRVSFNISIQRLILQLNKLDTIEYLEMVACSLRALFDIAVNDIRLTEKYPTLFAQKGLEIIVKAVIQYIASDNAKISTIASKSGMDFKSLKNRLLADEFHAAVKKSHLGAHKSTVYLTEPEMRDIANKASLFVVVANEMILNTI